MFSIIVDTKKLSTKENLPSLPEIGNVLIYNIAEYSKLKVIFIGTFVSSIAATLKCKTNVKQIDLD